MKDKPDFKKCFGEVEVLALRFIGNNIAFYQSLPIYPNQIIEIDKSKNELLPIIAREKKNGLNFKITKTYKLIKK